MFGSHLSIAGGMHNALLGAETLGLGTVQVFTKNCSITQWTMRSQRKADFYMGASMTGIIEWTDEAQCAARSDLEISVGEPRWGDDHLHGILFQTDKEYDFFAAIAGVRSRFNKLPLIPPRGVPARLSSPARRYFEDFGNDVAGWLHLSEIQRCISHVGVEPFFTDFEIEIGLELMGRLVARLSDAHVRLVFNIESP